MSEPLVSIIIPCYNAEKIMHRLMDSIVAQTYKRLEVILVNDGSTDNPKRVWDEYKDRFEEAGMQYQYIYQENQGLGAAINSGLKVFQGEYFCWADIDDYFEDTSIEKRVKFLRNNPEFGSVSSDANHYFEEDLAKPVGTLAEWMTHKKDEWQFRWLLLGQSLFCPGCHMVRTSSFLDVNPERYIYPARRGQNNQLLLPVYYKYKHGFIDEPLYNYITYKKSMSTPDTTREMAMNRIYEYLDLLKYTFEQMKLDEDTKEFCRIHLRELEWRNVSAVYCKYGEPFNLLKLYCKLKMYSTKSRKEIKRIIIAVHHVLKEKT